MPKKVTVRGHGRKTKTKATRVRTHARNQKTAADKKGAGAEIKVKKKSDKSKPAVKEVKQTPMQQHMAMLRSMKGKSPGERQKILSGYNTKSQGTKPALSLVPSNGSTVSAPAQHTNHGTDSG